MRIIKDKAFHNLTDMYEMIDLIEIRLRDDVARLNRGQLPV